MKTSTILFGVATFAAGVALGFLASRAMEKQKALGLTIRHMQKRLKNLAINQSLERLIFQKRHIQREWKKKTKN